MKIIAPDSHMVEHYQLRVVDCERIIAGIDAYIASLPVEQRQQIQDALDRMEDIRRRATAQRRIDLRQLLGDAR